MMQLIKVGGSCLHADVNATAQTIREILGYEPAVIVHGYGRHLDELLAIKGITRQKFISASGVPSHFTDLRILTASLMASDETRQALKLALDTLGISVLDGNGFIKEILKGKRNEKIRLKEGNTIRIHRDDYSGRIIFVKMDALNELLILKKTLLISPLFMDDKLNLLTGDADHVATSIAIAANIKKMYFLSDVPGLQIDGCCVHEVRRSELSELMKYARGGMHKKLKNISRCLDSGIETIHLLCGLNGKIKGGNCGTIFTQD